MSGFGVPTVYIPPIDPWGLPPVDFNMLIGQYGQRASWMKSHTCPCIFGPAGANGYLPTPGTPQASCQTCFGLGFYWDAPSPLFRLWMKFIEMSPTPDEPGTRMNDTLGMFQMSEPTISIPFQNPLLPFNDPGQPSTVWTEASTMDIFIPVDMLSRYVANLQVGGLQNVPFQQNMQIASTGAVTTWNTATSGIEQITGYVVSGATVTIPSGFVAGTNYMVEFYAAPLFIAYRAAGGFPHVRPFGGGSVNEPRRMKVQTLDFWSRQRGIQPLAPGNKAASAMLLPMGVMTGVATQVGP